MAAVGDARKRLAAKDVRGDVEALGLNVEVIAHIWREHSNCTWVSTGVNVMWSCGIWHGGPIYMQPTTRDKHVAALVMTQIEADRAIGARLIAEAERRGAERALLDAADALEDHTDCVCEGREDGNHLRHLAAPSWLRDRADSEAQR